MVPNLGPGGLWSPCHPLSGSCLLPFDPTGPGSRMETGGWLWLASSQYLTPGVEDPLRLQKLTGWGTWRSGGSGGIFLLSHSQVFASLSTNQIAQGRTQQGQSVGKETILQKVREGGSKAILADILWEGGGGRFFPKSLGPCPRLFTQ